MKTSILLAVDGSAGSAKAVEFAIERAERGGDGIILAHVIEWSPYSFNTPEENAVRHKRREEELARAQASILDPIAAEISAAGIAVQTEIRHGNIARTVIDLAEDNNCRQIIIGQRGESNFKELLFGSVASNLVQTSTVPVTVVP